MSFLTYCGIWGRGWCLFLFINTKKCQGGLILRAAKLHCRKEESKHWWLALFFHSSITLITGIRWSWGDVASKIFLPPFLKYAWLKTCLSENEMHNCSYNVWHSQVRRTLVWLQQLLMRFAVRSHSPQYNVNQRHSVLGRISSLDFCTDEVGKML